MQVSVETRAAEGLTADLLALPLARPKPDKSHLPARYAALDRAVGGRISAALGTGDFKGSRGDTLLVYGDAGDGVRRVLLVGLGEEREADAEALRIAAGRAVGLARSRRARRVVIAVPPLRRLRGAAAGQALAEGAILGGYRFDSYRSPEADATPAPDVALWVDGSGDARGVRAGVRIGTALAESQNLARDLSNEPPNTLPPAELASAAQQMAREVGLRCRVLDVPKLEKLGAGGILAVGGGSSRPPRLIVLEHNAPAKGARARPTVCVVGKGITFDSGGLSIKPAASMVSMKHDMSGAAAVVGALRACALLKVPLHVVGVIASAENMPSSTAYRPDDVVTTLSGKTVEIGNTDAEGRIVLSDALAYAQREFEPAAIIDLATLTGACAVALGTWCSAVLGTNERLIEALRRAGEATHERVWPLPLWSEHQEFMKGRVADLKQVGGRNGGTIIAAAFLSHFVGETPWAHLDIAPTADTDKPGPYQPQGATGVGVRLVVECLREWQAARVV
jgi:leucyl aminopeptidase